jgi:hypothetical protein
MLIKNVALFSVYSWAFAQMTTVAMFRNFQFLQFCLDWGGASMTCNLSTGKHLWMLFSLEELSIPVKFARTGEGLNDLQPFDVEALISCSFPWDVDGSSSMLGGADLMYAIWLWQDPISHCKGNWYRLVRSISVSKVAGLLKSKIIIAAQYHWICLKRFLEISCSEAVRVSSTFLLLCYGLKRTIICTFCLKSEESMCALLVSIFLGGMVVIFS